MKLIEITDSSSMNREKAENSIDSALNFFNLIKYILSKISTKIVIVDSKDEIVYSNEEHLKNNVGSDFKKVFNIKRKDQLKNSGTIMIDNISYDIKNHDFNNYKILYLEKREE